MADDHLPEILSLLRDQRDDRWGRHAGVVAEGIRQSSLDQRLSQSMETAARLGSETSAALHDIAGLLARSESLLQQVLHAVSNQQEVKAAEFARRGLTALRRGWINDAIEELEASLALNKYVSSVQCALGTAYLAADQPAAAATHFASAVYYADMSDGPLVAASALAGSAAAVAAGNPGAAQEVLDRAIRMVPDCPELLLEAAILTRDGSLTARVLRIAPELSLVALARDAPAVEGVCVEICADPESVVGKVERAEEIQAALQAGSQLSQAPVRTVPERMTHAGGLLVSGFEHLAASSRTEPGWDVVPDPGPAQRERDTAQQQYVDCVSAERRGLFMIGTGVVVGVAPIVVTIVIANSEWGRTPGAGGWSSALLMVLLMIGGVTLGIFLGVQGAKDGPGGGLDQARKRLDAAEQTLEQVQRRHDEAEGDMPARVERERLRALLRTALSGLPPARTRPLGSLTG